MRDRDSGVREKIFNNQRKDNRLTFLYCWSSMQRTLKVIFLLLTSNYSCCRKSAQCVKLIFFWKFGLNSAQTYSSQSLKRRTSRQSVHHKKDPQYWILKLVLAFNQPKTVKNTNPRGQWIQDRSRGLGAPSYPPRQLVIMFKKLLCYRRVHILFGGSLLTDHTRLLMHFSMHHWDFFQNERTQSRRFLWKWRVSLKKAFYWLPERPSKPVSWLTFKRTGPLHKE